ncbi:MAG: hypothetical protein K0U74_08820 [Alphaproteobacteria bacterium]|nr:hypothetical protein [Alphaproteobacteria bacterium]
MSYALAFGAIALLASSSLLAADTLDLTKPAPLTCETSAVILDANPFKASQGTILIEMRLDDPKAPKGGGRWKIASSSSDHDSSFAVTTPETCKPDCPLTQGKDGAIQLWSPKPMALTQIDDETTLVLVSIDPKTLELKASSFRNKQLAALERGECKLAATGDSAKPADPAPTDTDIAKPKADGTSAPAAQPNQTENPK